MTKGDKPICQFCQKKGITLDLSGLLLCKECRKDFDEENKQRGDKQKKVAKKHRHKWDDHCDCEYCELLVCINCGDEKPSSEGKKSWGFSRK